MRLLSKLEGSYSSRLQLPQFGWLEQRAEKLAQLVVPLNACIEVGWGRPLLDVLVDRTRNKHDGLRSWWMGTRSSYLCA